MRAHVFIGLIAMLSAGCVPVGSGAGLHGVYSDLRYSDESGDLNGFEAAFETVDGETSVVFTICEGGCYGGETWPVRIDGDRVGFEVSVAWRRSDGAPVEPVTTRYVGEFRGGALRLTSPDVPWIEATLRRMRNPEPGRTARLGGKTD